MTFGVAASGLAQALIAIDNNENTSLDEAATSNGLFWNGNALLNQDANLTLWAGSSPENLAPLKTFLLSNGSAIGSSVFGPGTWTDISGNTYHVPGVDGGSAAYFLVQIWLGDYSSFDAAMIAGSVCGQSTVFRQTLRNLNLPPPDLTAMPAVMLIPEPGVCGLACLGAAALLYRRK